MVPLPDPGPFDGSNLDRRVVGLGRTSAALVVFRHRGALGATVIVKATFALVRDADARRVEALPIERRPVDVAIGAPARFVSDLVPFVERAEITVTGTAFARAVGVQLFDGQRAIASRRIELGGAVSTPIVLTDAHGFGPIGIVDAPAIGRPIAELRAELGAEAFQSARPEQRFDHLPGGEWLVLEGMSPSPGAVRSRLPAARGVARIFGLAPFGVREGQPIALDADTLRVDADALRCSLSFRGTVLLANEASLAALRVVAGVGTEGEAIPWNRDDATPLAGRYRPASATPVAGGATMLLGGGGTVALSPSDLLAGPSAAMPSTVLLSESLGSGDDALPFAAPRGLSPHALATATPSLQVATGTVDLAAAIDDAEAALEIAKTTEPLAPRPADSAPKKSPWAPPPSAPPPAPAKAAPKTPDGPELDLLAGLFRRRPR